VLPRAKRDSVTQSFSAIICVFDAADNVIETREHTGDFKEP
jgi:hypothetical protein